ncbi:MAG: hypothetical protein JWO53_645 [Chlamydiia bacterium]|nr:hypothetical protein [Chlamydiia bacterium]
MWIYACIPFFLQAIAISFDEGYFHYQRGLPKWERIGHPIDTLSLLLCLMAALWLPFTEFNMKVYIGLAIISCLMVTKDEFVHKHHCPGAENWLHACLFILHPITLIVAGFIWPVVQGADVPAWVSYWLDSPLFLKDFLLIQVVLIALFFFYQIIFWNFIWKDRPVLKM